MSDSATIRSYDDLDDIGLGETASDMDSDYGQDYGDDYGSDYGSDVQGDGNHTDDRPPPRQYPWQADEDLPRALSKEKGKSRATSPPKGLSEVALKHPDDGIRVVGRGPDQPHGRQREPRRPRGTRGVEDSKARKSDDRFQRRDEEEKHRKSRLDRSLRQGEGGRNPGSRRDRRRGSGPRASQALDDVDNSEDNDPQANGPTRRDEDEERKLRRSKGRRRGFLDRGNEDGSIADTESRIKRLEEQIASLKAQGAQPRRDGILTLCPKDVEIIADGCDLPISIVEGWARDHWLFFKGQDLVLTWDKTFFSRATSYVRRALVELRELWDERIDHYRRKFGKDADLLKILSDDPSYRHRRQYFREPRTYLPDY